MSVLDTEGVPVHAPEPVVPAGRGGLLSSWAATVTVTAVSTYALDGIATAAGVLLVASGALGGLGHLHALVFLAATYAAWGMGLRANLRANWSLLEQTGMSTNALSKAAHDLTRRRHTSVRDRRHTSVRDRRIASAAGYLGLELAKEAPYYAGAFGAAVLSDSVSSTVAILFLAGTNLGAAGYEYALARLTRFVLRCAPPTRGCASTLIRCREGTSPSTPAESSPQETRTNNASAGQRRRATRSGQRAPWVAAPPGRDGQTVQCSASPRPEVRRRATVREPTLRPSLSGSAALRETQQRPTSRPDPEP